MKLIKVLIKFLIITLISIILITAIATSLFIYLYPKDQLLVIIKNQAEKKLHRKVKIDQINYSLSGVTLSKIIVSNSINNINSDYLFYAEKVNLKFSLLSLLEKKLLIKHIKIIDPVFNISYKDDKYNFYDLLDKEKNKNETDNNSNKNDNDSNKNKNGIKTTISSLTIENAEINLLSCQKKLTPLIGNYKVNFKINFHKNNRYSIPYINFDLPKKRGKINGFLEITKIDSDYQITGNIKLNDLFINWTKKIDENYSHPIVKISGDLENINIKKNLLSFNLKSKQSLTNNTILSTNGYIKIITNPFFLNIQNMKIYSNNSVCTINYLKYKKNPKLLDFKLDNINLNINDIKPHLKMIPKKLYGNFKGKLSFKKDKINASLDLQNAGYNKNFISGINGKVVIENNNFKIKKLPFKYYNQDAIISIASIGSYKNLVANIYIKNFVFQEKVSNNKKTKKTKKIEEKINIPVNIKGRIEIEKFKIKEYEFNKIFLSYALFNNLLNIARLKTTFLNTDFIGNGNVDFRKNNPFFNFNVSFHNFKVQKLAIYSKKRKARLFGNADGKVNINFNLKNNRPFLEALNSKIKFQINNGKLVNTGIQNGLGIWLSPLKHKLKDLEFNQIYGDILKNNINYTINSFKFNSPNIRLAIIGNFTHQASGDLNIILEFNKYFIQDLPKLATLSFLNNYKKGKWYLFKFRDKGKDITNSKNIKQIN